MCIEQIFHSQFASIAKRFPLPAFQRRRRVAYRTRKTPAQRAETALRLTDGAGCATSGGFHFSEPQSAASLAHPIEQPQAHSLKFRYVDALQ